MRIPKPKVEVFRDRLRIRFTYQKQTYSLTLGLEDNKTNRRIAEGKAAQIQHDLERDEFDPTLEKYKRKKIENQKEAEAQKSLSLDLWKAYTSERENDLAKRTIYDKFKPIQSRIEQYGKDVKTKEDAEKFSAFLAQFNEPRQVKDKITSINAAYKWGIQQKLVNFNPFNGLAATIKLNPKKDANPFTKEEIEQIIDGFSYEPHNFYQDYVKFLFLTGCRTGEAIGLRWEHVKSDFSEIWIGESITRGVKKSTKTGKARIFPCNEQLKKLLSKRFQEIKSESSISDRLVFPSPEGKPINDGNFLDRHWKVVLKQCDVSYRPQYNTRHTFISHMLAEGLEPLKIAKITGHDVKVLLERYAGIVSRIEIPELI